MKKILILLSTLVVIGCNPRELPNPIIPPPPKQTESVIPTVKQAKVDVDETIINNVKIGDKLGENKQTVSDQKLSIIEALTQAEKIKEKALAKVAISELEVLDLISELKKVEARNLFLEKQNDELSKLSKDQEKILKIIKDTLDKTEKLAYNKEEEAYTLREQNVYLSKNLTDKSQESESLKKQLTKEKEVSASAKVYKNWVIGLVSAFIAWLVIKNILMIYFPLTKFRI